MSEDSTYLAILNRFAGLTGIVVGDVMLDEYIFGEVTRISPEAPVMVVKRKTESHVPGGAANVAANIAALGAKPLLVGLIGRDREGTQLSEALEASGIAASGLCVSASRPTTTKTRVVANHAHQVLRIDRESDDHLRPEEQERLEMTVRQLLPTAGFLLLSDYAKGCLSSGLIGQFIADANEFGKPVIANPKPGTVRHYAGAQMVSLNRKEACAVLDIKTLEPRNAAEAAKTLRKQLQVESVVITLGGDGMAVAFADESAFEPAIAVEVYDEAGAGDTAIAALALCYASGVYGQAALGLATRLAGAVVKKVGVAVPNRADIESVASERVSSSIHAR